MCLLILPQTTDRLIAPESGEPHIKEEVLGRTLLARKVSNVSLQIRRSRMRFFISVSYYMTRMHTHVTEPLHHTRHSGRWALRTSL
jgi:hypothetical protein